MNPIPDRILVLFSVPEMFVADTPFRRKIIFQPVYICTRRNTAHIGQGCLAPVIRVTGTEIPSYIFQVQAGFTENLVPVGNKLADMGTTGKIVVFSPYITVSFKPDFILIGFQSYIQLRFRPA